jgi:hypothetical protein
VGEDARLQENQQRFRRGNEAINRALASMGGDASCDVSYVCECADPLCFEEVTLRADQYRHLRASSDDLYVVVPGHENEALETVIGTIGPYLVVEKH